jgi:hypothetical protein
MNGKNLALCKFYLHNSYIGTEKYSDSNKSDTVSGWGKVRHGVPQGSTFSSINK